MHRWATERHRRAPASLESGGGKSVKGARRVGGVQRRGETTFEPCCGGGTGRDVELVLIARCCARNRTRRSSGRFCGCTRTGRAWRRCFGSGQLSGGRCHRRTREERVGPGAESADRVECAEVGHRAGHALGDAGCSSCRALVLCPRRLDFRLYSPVPKPRSSTCCGSTAPEEPRRPPPGPMTAAAAPTNTCGRRRGITIGTVRVGVISTGVGISGLDPAATPWRSMPARTSALTGGTGVRRTDRTASSAARRWWHESQSARCGARLLQSTRSRPRRDATTTPRQ